MVTYYFILNNNNSAPLGEVVGCSSLELLQLSLLYLKNVVASTMLRPPLIIPDNTPGTHFEQAESTCGTTSLLEFFARR